MKCTQGATPPRKLDLVDFGCKLWLVGLFILHSEKLCAEPSPDTSSSQLKVAAFSCDVTPPIGHPLCGGWIKPLEAVDDPLLAKGVVLTDGRTRYVLCAVDWCLLQTDAHAAFQRKLATAVGVPERQVSVHTVHQHNAPIADAAAERLLRGTSNAPPHLNLEFLEEVSARVAQAAQAACGRLQPFTHVGFGQAKVEHFASNRRVRLADGVIRARTSTTKDPVLRHAPEGLIDPWLKTITLLDGDRPLVRLHYYATHPMSYYGDGRATSDTVGLARARLEREEGVPQIYFTGCGGNITAGKYNDGTPASRLELTERIYRAMREAAAATNRAAVPRLDWRTTSVRFHLRPEPEWVETVARQTIANTTNPPLARITAALNLAWIERWSRNPGITISSLRLGPVTTLQLQAESFVEYQLYAENLDPSRFLAVAAYGESGPGYICLDAALKEGGYEPTEARVGPPTEFELKQGIAELLDPPRRTKPPFYPDKRHLLTFRDPKGIEHSIASAKTWAKRRAHILAGMREVMGDVPKASAQPPLDLRVLDEEVLAEFTRRRVTFAGDDGERVPAYLLMPRSLHGKAPAVICLHQTTEIGKGEPAGLGGNADLHYAAELAGRGYVTLAPDYPNFGEYRFDPYAAGYASATRKGIRNHQRAVDLLTSLPEVDKHRLAVIGHSLGGHNALFLAAFEPRIQAVVTSCGFDSFFSYKAGDLTGWSHAGYMPRIASTFSNDPKLMPFDFSEVLAAIAPRAVFVSAPMKDTNFDVAGVKDCMVAAEPVYRLLGAGTQLTARYPDCGHEFPPAVRKTAYDWLDEKLKTPR